MKLIANITPTKEVFRSLNKDFFIFFFFLYTISASDTVVFRGRRTNYERVFEKKKNAFLFFMILGCSGGNKYLCKIRQQLTFWVNKKQIKKKNDGLKVKKKTESSSVSVSLKLALTRWNEIYVFCFCFYVCNFFFANFHFWRHD